MSMHLEHPALSYNGKKKGKIKFRNAEEARKARELDASWKELQAKWELDADEKRRQRAFAAAPLNYSLNTPIGRTNTHHIPSRVSPVQALPQFTRCIQAQKFLALAQCTKAMQCLSLVTKRHMTLPQ